MSLAEIVAGDGYRFVFWKILLITFIVFSLDRRFFGGLLFAILVLFTFKLYTNNWFWTKYGVYPLWLLFIPLIDSRLPRKKIFGFLILTAYALWSFMYDYRTGFYSSIIMMFLLTFATSRVSFLVLMALPVFKLMLGYLLYAMSIEPFSYIDETPSNIERYCMDQTSLSNFFNFILTGPLASLDAAIQECTFGYGITLYQDVGGVDFHSFLLSLWRDSGALVSIIVVIIYVCFALKISNKISKSYLNKPYLTVLLVWPILSFATGTPDMLTILICLTSLSYAYKFKPATH